MIDARGGPGRAAGLAMMLAVAAVGCGSTGPAAPTPGDGLSPAIRREAVSPNPSFDFGLTVQITPNGVHPQQLVAPCCDAITWRNLTTATVSVVFDHQPVRSGPVPPGGTYRWRPPNIESVTYHAGAGPAARGAIQVNATER